MTEREVFEGKTVRYYSVITKNNRTYFYKQKAHFKKGVVTWKNTKRISKVKYLKGVSGIEKKKQEAKTRFVWVIGHYVSDGMRTSVDVAVEMEVPADASAMEIYAMAYDRLDFINDQSIEFTDVIDREMPSNCDYEYYIYDGKLVRIREDRGLGKHARSGATGAGLDGEQSGGMGL